MDTKIIAKLIDETSAGLSVVQIYDENKLVWAHNYFSEGATDAQYKGTMLQIFDDMIACSDYADFEGCDFDEEGEIMDALDEDTAYVALEFCAGEWKSSSREYDGQTADFITLNRHRLPGNIK